METLVEDLRRRGHDHLTAREALGVVIAGLHARLSSCDRRGSIASLATGIGTGFGICYLLISWDPHHVVGVAGFSNPTFLPVVLWAAALVQAARNAARSAQLILVVALLMHLAIAVGTLLPNTPWLGPNIPTSVAFVLLGILGCTHSAQRKALMIGATVAPGAILGGVLLAVQVASV